MEGRTDMNELLLVVLAIVLIFSFMWYQDKRRKQREQSDKLNNWKVNSNNEKQLEFDFPDF